MREDWEESEEGGGTTGRATAVTIELLELYNREGNRIHISSLRLSHFPVSIAVL